MASVFSDDIAIDLGTANTLVSVVGRGIIIDEPSMVAVQTRDGGREIVAVGRRAREMEGRKDEGLSTLKPMRDGVIADFVATEEMLRQFIRRAKSRTGFRRPQILISVPAGATPVERRAVYETAVSAGARKVHLIEEPVAAAIGAGLDFGSAAGVMVVDIGGGTTDVAVLARSGVVQARALRCAGNAMDEAIVRHIRRRYHLVIGQRNAERIKTEAGSVDAGSEVRPVEIHIRGRDVQRGALSSVTLTSADIAEALAVPVDSIIDFVQRSLEDLPPDLAADVARSGLQLTGGGSQLHGLRAAMSGRLGVPVSAAANPLHSVVLGSAQVLQELARWDHLLISA